MSIRVALSHKTHYRFDRRVSLSPMKSVCAQPLIAGRTFRAIR